jgi:cytochrome P450
MTLAPALPVTDLSDPIMFSDPFPHYAELRRRAPVSLAIHRESTRRTVYMLTRYQDVMTLHTDPRFSSDAISQGGAARLTRFMPRMFRLLTDSMVFKDDPAHKRLRGLVNKAFTPKIVQQMADDVQFIVDELVAGLAAKREVDLIADLAVPLPLSVISNMLGVGDDERDEFRASMERFAGSAAGGSPIEMIRMLPTGRRMVQMFDRMAAQRRLEPDDRLITALVRANEGSDALSDNEIVSMIFLLLLAGFDTTSNLIGASMLALLDHPDQLARLRDDPNIDERAVEELLRFTTPVPCGVTRTMTADIEIAGTTIPKGGSVIGMIISANRDEEVFDAPDTLDLGRDPNRHITFAFGTHYCLGNQLARMEGRMALQALVRRFDHIELAVSRDQLRWKPTETLRGLRSLPLSLSGYSPS